MKGTVLGSLGFEIPDDFPKDSYKKVILVLSKYSNKNKLQSRCFSLGWNGLAYRYRAMAEYDEQFTSSIKKYGNAPPHDERYKQDNAVFGFFVCSVSTIESFFYSAYCIASILQPDKFPLDSKSQKHLYPKKISSTFDANLHNDALTDKMQRCIRDNMFITINDMRDVLSHRGMPGRNFYMGGEREGMATFPKNPKALPEEWKLDFPIDQETTSSMHIWLCTSLTELVVATDDFCDRKLK